jgi:hypothetical protein
VKIQALIDSLKTVTEDFPEAEFELGFCDCCIYVVIDGKKVAALNVEEDRFEYLAQYPAPLPPDEMDYLRAMVERGKGVR